MTQKQKRYLVSSLGVIFVVALGAISAVLLTKHSQAEAATKAVAQQALTITPKFSFTGTPDWRQGPSNETSMALFHTGNNGCFVSAEYNTGVIDEISALQKSLDAFTTTGYAVTPSSTQAMSMSSNTGQLHYQLHQYSVKATSSTPPAMEGNEFGFITLNSGYIKVEGHCDNTAALPATISALQALKFIATN